MTFYCNNLLHTDASKKATDYKTINFQYHWGKKKFCK